MNNSEVLKKKAFDIVQDLKNTITDFNTAGYDVKLISSKHEPTLIGVGLKYHPIRIICKVINEANKYEDHIFLFDLLSSLEEFEKNYKDGGLFQLTKKCNSD
jgi:hypothetical protein